MTTYSTASPMVRKTKRFQQGHGWGMVPCTAEQKPCHPTKLNNARYYYNKARDAVYARYTDCDWDMSNNVNYCMAEHERDLAQEARKCAWDTVALSEKVTVMRRRDNEKKLADRIKDIQYWKDKLTTERNDMEKEINDLKGKRALVMQAIEDSKVPLAIAEESMIQREKRTGLGQVLDDAERGLSEEVLIIRECQRRLKELFEQIRVQLKLNRAAQQACMTDIHDKKHAERIDTRIHRLDPCSPYIGFHARIEDFDTTNSDTLSWEDYSNENCERSRQERQNSSNLRQHVQDVVDDCARLLWCMAEHINDAMTRRVNEIEAAKRKMEDHLNEINHEIEEMERTIRLLKCAIEEKEGPLKLAQTRLDERSRRHCVENCYDHTLKGLQVEVYEIRQSITNLKERLRCAELSLCRLTKTQYRLLQDIASKNQNIQIDTQCSLAMHKNMSPKLPMAKLARALCSQFDRF